MKCLTPNEIRTNIDFETGEVLPWYHKMLVPCGKCYECLSARRAEWASRLNCESQTADISYFVTLTLENTPYHDFQYDSVKKEDLQKYFKRLRKNLNSSQNNNTLKYYAIGEYGSKFGRPHYHALMFFYNISVSEIFLQHRIEDSWPFGFSKIEKVHPANVNYILHYHVRPKEREDGRKTFALQSQGLGLAFMTDNVVNHLNQSTKLQLHNKYTNGNLIFPRYYRKKLGIRIDNKEIDHSLDNPVEKIYKYMEDNQVDYDTAYRVYKDYIELDKQKLLKYNSQEKF